MKLFSSQDEISKRLKTDVLVLPFHLEGEKVKSSSNIGEIKEFISSNVLKGFGAKEGEIRLLYVSGNKESRIVLLGIGAEKEFCREQLLTVYARLAKFLRREKITTANVVIPTVSSLKRVSCSEFLASVCEGILSANYPLPVYGKKVESVDPVLKKVSIIGVASKIADPIFRKYEKIFDGVYLTRDLVNGNADEVTPSYLASVAEKLSKTFPSLKVSILNKEAIKKEKMGLLMAVSKGAALDPRLVVLQYQGKPKSKDKTVLVGKGVTFDSGGLDLKPGKSMLTMKEDMAGAATVLGIMSAVASLKLPINVSAVIPATENAIGSKAYKMGDVYIGKSGLSVEIGSTDAEGRLILGDAISYAIDKLQPTRIIDFATLTGAMVISLGESVAGFFSNSDKLAEQLEEASLRTAETIWRMPLVKAYEKAISSEIADIKNIGSNRAGAITAALFLKRFVADSKVDWVHFDIAGTAYLEKSDAFYQRYATGFGVRLMISYLENIK